MTGVDVVIPYYRDQPMLDRILAALRHQRGIPAGRGAPEADSWPSGLRIFVADDGSPTPPIVPPQVTVLHQDDLGFRASAARHLGAQAGDGEILLFLDGDTVPGPDYVATMCAALEGNPDLLVVGRRRYGRFAENQSTDGPAAENPAADGPAAENPALAAALEPVEVLPDPAWPADFYAETGNLTRGEDLWRGVLSAVCGLHRRLYDLAGGFDPDIVGYGGEDWDLAWRCEQAGGRLRHVPDAVAWHDGPDWSGRVEGTSDDPDAPHPAGEKLARKNLETARLAPLIASPRTRPVGGIFALPLIAVHVHADDPAFAGTGTTAATCASLLRWGDVAVSVDPATADAALLAEAFSSDPRISLDVRGQWWRAAVPGAGPRRRPQLVVDLHRPCALGALDAARLRALCAPTGSVTIDDDEGRTLARVRTSGVLAREQEWGDPPARAVSIPAADLAPDLAPGQSLDDAPGQSLDLPDHNGVGVRLERVFGGW